MAASSWNACPRCLAKDGIRVPLTFELGWRGDRSATREPDADDHSDERSTGKDGSARDTASS